MHELGFLTGVVRVATTAATGRRVTAVGLTVGSRSGLIPAALEAAWPLATADTCCADASLELSWVPATVHCPNCAKEVEIDEYFALSCPVCATPTGDLRSGAEATISYVDVDDAPN